MKRTVITLIALVALVGLWYAFRPERLFVNQSVSESFPAPAPAQTVAAKGQPVLVASGNFHDGAHATKGTASIFQLPDGKQVLRLTGFETSNGPDVRVFLVAADDAKDNDTVKNAGYVEVAPLKGNVGDQNYDLPAGLNLAKYRAVTIWCNRFGVNFGTAPLMAGQTAAVSSQPVALLEGMFHDGAHVTKGTATIFQLPDGKRVLRLTQFETSNGPDVRIFLVAAEDAKDNDTVKNAGFIEVAPLKGNVGDQNYDLPQGVDLNKYRAVTIWCNRFSVNFGTAPLHQS